MQNYRVEVQNHSEAMEAQDLFFGMGYRKGVCIDSRYPKLIVTDNYDDDWYSAGAMIYYSKECKQITLQELRAMVAPKQKEYLVKTDTSYTLQVLSDVVDGHDGIIEVPKDAMSYWECNKHNVKFFSKIEKGSHFYHYLNKNSKWALWNDADFKTFKMKWQRESLNDQAASAEEYRKSFTHTPKATLDVINNMQNAFEKAQGAINAQNAMAKLFSYPQYISGVAHGKEFIVKPNNKKKDESGLVNDGQSIMDGLVDSSKSNGFSEGGFIPKQNHGAPVGLLHHGFSGFTQPEELPFVSDTQQTLNERQSQYGDFKDVAGMTQELLAVMEQYGYSDIPNTHKEALHMICSKMARIVNGDHNHLDSWHDICGYAKLIENNIK